MWKYNYSSELYHHGILGQKWGVRRYQEYPKGKHGTFLGQERDKDVVIKKGAESYRLQTGDKLQGEGQTYVSFNKLDSLQYASITSADSPGGLGVNMFDGTGRIVTLKLTNDIIAPSYQKTMDSFIRTVDELGLKNVAKDQSDKDKAKEFIKNYKHLEVDECRDKAYETFTRTFMKDTKAKEMFFNDLKNQGYNAIIDENDKHFGNGFSDSPMIIFDKKGDLKVTKATSLTEKDCDYFCDLYFVGNDDPYLKKQHSETISKWDKWAGTSDRRAV